MKTCFADRHAGFGFFSGLQLESQISCVAGRGIAVYPTKSIRESTRPVS